ncbi:MAG TPA: hypothetical protein VFC96_01685, partial [Anaerovoracaceae bacterium]|nr:hypothetical protein [Anaerovoracaceae bacterium]
IIYCIFLIKNLIPAAKTLNRVLNDAERITHAAADGVEEAQKTVINVSHTLSGLSDTLKGDGNMVQGLTSLIKAFTTFVGLFRNKKID